MGLGRAWVVRDGRWGKGDCAGVEGGGRVSVEGMIWPVFENGDNG